VQKNDRQTLGIAAFFPIHLMALAHIEQALGVSLNGGVELGFRHFVRPLQRLYFQRQARADGQCLYRATFPTLSHLLNFHLFLFLS
jgi:hypothetical protein